MRWTPSLKVAVAVLVVALLATVVFLRILRSELATPSTETEVIGFDDAQRLLRCTGIAPIDRLEAPIRGGAADRGVICTTGGATVHVFEAARIGMGGRLDYRSVFGLNDDVSDPHPPECPVQVTVGRGLVIVSPSEEVARRVEDAVGMNTTSSPMAHRQGTTNSRADTRLLRAVIRSPADGVLLSAA